MFWLTGERLVSLEHAASEDVHAHFGKVSVSAGPGQTLILTTNPRLDQAAAQSAQEWELAARKAGAAQTVAWLVRRGGDANAQDALHEVVEQLLEAEDAEDLAAGRIELAELVEIDDDLLAETLLEAVLQFARESGDGDMVATVTSQLAGIAERQGDPLTAAEYHLDFLNWRRQPGHVSDPDDIENAFDEIVRYASDDSEPAVVALFSHRQAAFTRLLEMDDDRASSGDWERDDTPYRGWA